MALGERNMGVNTIIEPMTIILTDTVTREDMKDLRIGTIRVTTGRTMDLNTTDSEILTPDLDKERISELVLYTF